MQHDLVERRERLERERSRFDADPSGPRVSPDVLASWMRCGVTVDTAWSAAPGEDADEALDRWSQSPIRRAMPELTQQLVDVAEDGDFLVGITDAEGRVLWSAGGRRDATAGRATQLHARGLLGRTLVGDERGGHVAHHRPAHGDVLVRALVSRVQRRGLLLGTRPGPGRARARRPRPDGQLGPHQPAGPPHGVVDGSDGGGGAGPRPHAPRGASRSAARGAGPPRGVHRRRRLVADAAPDGDPRHARRSGRGQPRRVAHAGLRRPDGVALHDQGRDLPPATRRSVG